MPERRLDRFRDEKSRPWRKKVRERLDSLDGKERRRVRARVAKELSREANKRLFKALKLRSRKEREKAQGRIDRLKQAAIRTWKPDLRPIDVQELADRATIRKVTSAVRAKERAVFVPVKKRGKTVGYRRSVVKKIKGRYVRKGVGEVVEQSTVNRSIAAHAYWRRIRALARALDIRTKSGELDLVRTRRLDKLLLDVPDALRRRVYERIVLSAVGRPSRKKRRKRRA